MTITKQGRAIRTMEDWQASAGPKQAHQWQADRSAMEAARVWLEVASPELPREIAAALSQHPDFGTISRWEAEPEARLPFDEFRGEPRNADLLVKATDEHGEFLIAVEAKADETFGTTVSEALAAAARRKRENSRSRGVERIQQLQEALFRRITDEPFGQLRYQLLTAVAGAVAAASTARGVRVVVLVQEFQTSRTEDSKQESNARDLDAFVNQLTGGAIQRVAPGEIHGPIAIPGRPLFERVPPLYLGKVTRNLRT